MEKRVDTLARIAGRGCVIRLRRPFWPTDLSHLISLWLNETDMKNVLKIHEFPTFLSSIVSYVAKLLWLNWTSEDLNININEPLNQGVGN